VEAPGIVPLNDEQGTAWAFPPAERLRGLRRISPPLVLLERHVHIISAEKPTVLHTEFTKPVKSLLGTPFAPGDKPVETVDSLDCRSGSQSSDSRE
jgi:hypothetical protein